MPDGVENCGFFPELEAICLWSGATEISSRDSDSNLILIMVVQAPVPQMQRKEVKIAKTEQPEYPDLETIDSDP